MKRDGGGLFAALQERVDRITHLQSARALLGWDADMVDNVPVAASEERALVTGSLERIIHEHRTDPRIEALCQDIMRSDVDEVKRAVADRLLEDYERLKKLPAAFVQKQAEATARSARAWRQAKEANDFTVFRLDLEKIVDIMRERAQLLGYENVPYDALIDESEPGMTIERIQPIFKQLRQFLVPFVARLAQAPGRLRHVSIDGYSIPVQKEVSRTLAAYVGFDFSRGRLDTGPHPQMGRIHRSDVRLVSRYQDDDVYRGISNTIHEVGHGLYEQGLDVNLNGPLSESVSLGLHEGIAHLYECMVGRDPDFLAHACDVLNALGGSRRGPLQVTDLIACANAVAPSLIRVDADEVTYVLHILIRFELETALIDGTLAVGDLPEAFNAKMQEYLGIQVPDDAQGVLQDCHWGEGYFGYFPVYALGKVYSAQFFAAAHPQRAPLDARALVHIKEWLTARVFRYGRRYTTNKLVAMATGSPPDPTAFIKYLQDKYTVLYQL